MGLPISVHVRGPAAGSDAVSGLVEGMFEALRADDALFSTWKPDSPVSHIRDGRDSLQDAHPRVRHVVALCEVAAQRTGGAFSAWRRGPDGRVRFDPTGLVKGWAVEQAFTTLTNGLQELGAHDALVNAGGDIAVQCRRTDTPNWVVAVEDPHDRSRILRTLRLRTGAVATSGTAARPTSPTRQPESRPSGLLSATVVGPELTWRTGTQPPLSSRTSRARLARATSTTTPESSSTRRDG